MSLCGDEHFVIYLGGYGRGDMHDTLRNEAYRSATMQDFNLKKTRHETTWKSEA
jgi:hypothetical protein